MWEFLDRLAQCSAPHPRLSGLSPNSFDGRGNYSLGIREQVIFPEIEYDKIDKIRGLAHDHHDRPDRRRGLELLLERSGCRSPRRGGRAQVNAEAEAAEEERRKEEARAHGPRPRRPRSSSSRKRTPRLTRSPSARTRRKARRAKRRKRPPPDAESALRPGDKKEKKKKKKGFRNGQDFPARPPEPASRSTRRATTIGVGAAVAPRAYFRKFGLCRICLREAAHQGYVPGMTKSSW